MPELQLQLDEQDRGKHVQPQEGRLHLDQQGPKELRVVRQPALPAGGGAAGARCRAGQVPRDAHVRHLRPPAQRHEGCGAPAGPRPGAREGEEGLDDRVEGSHERRPTKLDKSFHQGTASLIFLKSRQCRQLVAPLDSHPYNKELLQSNVLQSMLQVQQERKGEVTVFYCGNPGSLFFSFRVVMLKP